MNDLAFIVSMVTTAILFGISHIAVIISQKNPIQGAKNKMVKFYEFTDRGDGRKILVNIDQIVSIVEEENGLVFVQSFVGSVNSGEVAGYYCMEKYVDVYNDLAARDFI